MVRGGDQMKQFDVKSQRTIEGNRFYVRPFPAFVSANLGGELMSSIIPAIGAVLPLVAGDDKNTDILNLDAEVAAPALSKGLSGLNGDKVESLLKKLLVTHKNISVQFEDDNEVQPLTEDLANELFCGDAQDMFILAYDVIKANFSGFFKKLGAFLMRECRAVSIIDKLRQLR
jgi:hypothetical protein